ncbi:TBC1 domain family member 2 [Pancytospora epiphaga]|nr:TBC1 domain family member 2 [Pancytospora epiphaga]
MLFLFLICLFPSFNNIIFSPSMKEDSEQSFEEILSQRIIEPTLFKRLCYTGIPMKYRLVSYMILLDIFGLDTSKFKPILERKKLKYIKYFDRLAKYNLGKSTVENIATNVLLEPILTIDPVVENQIRLDITRISTDLRWFNGIDYSEVFYNVLRVTAYKRPYIGYVQGMADIVSPFLYLHFIKDGCYTGKEAVNIQSIVYHCFSGLMNKIQTDIFQVQDCLLEKLERVLHSADQPLYEHLRMIGLELHMVCFRWFGCLFIREFSVDVWFRIFDSMLCSEISKFSVFFAAALLIWHREYILASDFCEIVTKMQNLQESNISIENVESLIGTSNYLYREHGND